MITDNNENSLIRMRINRQFALLTFVLFSAGRIIGDFFLYTFTSYSGIIPGLWKFLTFSILFLSAFGYVFTAKINRSEIDEDKSSESFFRDFNMILIYISGLIISFIIIPSDLITDCEPGSLFYLILNNFVNIYVIISVNKVGFFLYKWLNVRRHNQTRILVKIVLLILLLYFITEFIQTAFSLKSNITIDAGLGLLGLTLFIITLILTKRSSWVAMLPKGNKLKLLGMTLTGIVITSVTSKFMLRDSALGISMNTFFYGFSGPGATIILIADFYFIRLFFSSLVSLPTSSVVEKKTSELDSLAYLNRIVSKTIDFNTLIDTVTQLAMLSCDSHGAWTEIYDKDGKLSIWSLKFLEKSDIEFIHEKGILKERYEKLSSPALISSVPDDPELKYISDLIPIAKSMIAVPLFSGDDRIGTMTLFCAAEYGFEYDDLGVITAFSDNVNIALENARLLQDSIEKEHYKKELKLAREMQKKLLPLEIPVLENYSVSALSIPAEEVGGDYYDIGKLKNGKTCILIGDVSGKGMNAAFYMAQLKGVAMSLMQESHGASDLLKRINNILFRSVDKQIFITLSCIVINDNSGNLTLSRAGHMPAIVQNDGTTDILTPNGLGTCIADSNIFDEIIEEVNIKLEYNGICLLFTDGLNELRNPYNEDFGIEPLEKILSSNNIRNAVDVTSEIEKNVRIFSAESKQNDDLTLVALMYHNEN